MTTSLLFGIDLAPLYAAIAHVESDQGKTSLNVYQIDVNGSVYTDDVNRIKKKYCLFYGVAYRPFQREAKNSRSSSEEMMRLYWSHWGEHYEKKTGKPVTMEVLARIHNGGPLGWKKHSTVAYWKRVEAVLQTQTSSDVDAWSKGCSK